MKFQYKFFFIFNFSFGKIIPWYTSFSKLHKPSRRQFYNYSCFFTCIIINTTTTTFSINLVIFPNYFEEISHARVTNF